jgi:phospholipid/cholesterol/gamma-HCH transport system substrate-binding protein
MPDEMRLIPRDVRARIIPPTLFGGKYVELYAPSGSNDPIAAGATIRASDVTVEINDTFAHLMSLLKATKPAKVNAALTALATALQGRGHEAGQLLTKLDVYLQQINPTLGTLQHDLPLAKSVLGTYSALTPALLRTARNLSRTGDTIQNNQASLDAFLLSLTTVSRKTTTFVQRNEHNLTTTLDVLPPTERVLAEYAPEFPCFFRALVYPAIPLAEDAIGGKQPGLGVLAQFLPPEPAYRYPRDLPKIAADAGPNCYGLPDIPMGQQHQHQVFDTGRDPYAHETGKPGLTPENLLELFFGPLNGAGS